MDYNKQLSQTILKKLIDINNGDFDSYYQYDEKYELATLLAFFALFEERIVTIDKDDYLREHVHYIADYDEKLAYGLSCGANAAINVPIVGLEACGTSWMKDIGNFCLLISTHDGGVADCPQDSYLSITGKSEGEEIESLYLRMEEAASSWQNDFDLEYWIRTELKNYLPVISGTRMMKDYLEYLF